MTNNFAAMSAVFATLPEVNTAVRTFLDAYEAHTVNKNDKFGKGHDRCRFEWRNDKSLRPEFAGQVIPSLEYVLTLKFPDAVKAAGSALELLRAAEQLGGFTVSEVKDEFTRADGEKMPRVTHNVQKIRGSRDLGKQYENATLVEGFI